MRFEEIKNQLRGPAVLVMSPFSSNYELNLDALRENIRFIIDGGITKGNGFIICPCGTGEYNTLTREEHLEVVEAAIETCGDNVPLVVGVASTSHIEAIERCRNAERAGAKIVMLPPPYYYRGLDQEAVVRWYQVIADSCDLGIMVYDQSWRNLGGTVDTPAIEELAKIESVVSIKRGQEPDIKDYIGALERFSDQLAFIDNSYGYTAALAHMHGASGYITGIAAFWPQGEAEFWNLLEQRRYAEAEALHARQYEFWDFADNRMGGYATNVLKACAEYAGIPVGSVRPPFRNLSSQERETLHAILYRMGVREGVATR